MDINNQFTDIGAIKSSSIENIKNKNLNEDKALKEVCNDFESFFMNQFLETSLKTTNVAGEGTGSDIIKGMYTDSISRQSGGALGISDILYKFLSEKKS